MDPEITSNEAPAESPSIADSLGSALESVGLDEAPEGAASEPASKEGRDPQGRFAKRTSDTPAHVQPPAALPTPQEGVTAPAGQPQAPQGAETPPTSWSPEEKATWAALPPVAREAIQRRERETERGLLQAAQSRKFGDSVYQEVAPYMEILRAEGATPQAAIKTLLETAYVLRHGSPEHKRGLMLSLIQQYGVDFSRPVDQERAALERELDARRHGDLRARAQQNVEIERGALTEVEQFAAAPGHEDMPALRDHMVALLNAGTAKTLQDAYDQAAWAHPQVRAKMQAKENVARNQNLSRNRNAASSVTGNPGPVSTGVSTNAADLRGTIEAALGGGRL